MPGFWPSNALVDISLTEAIDGGGGLRLRRERAALRTSLNDVSSIPRATDRIAFIWPCFAVIFSPWGSWLESNVGTLWHKHDDYKDATTSKQNEVDFRGYRE